MHSKINCEGEGAVAGSGEGPPRPPSGRGTAARTAVGMGRGGGPSVQGWPRRRRRNRDNRGRCGHIEVGGGTADCGKVRVRFRTRRVAGTTAPQPRPAYSIHTGLGLFIECTCDFWGGAWLRALMGKVSRESSAVTLVIYLLPTNKYTVLKLLVTLIKYASFCSRRRGVALRRCSKCYCNKHLIANWRLHTKLETLTQHHRWILPILLWCYQGILQAVWCWCAEMKTIEIHWLY